MLIRIIASYNISYLTFVYNNKQMTNNKYSKALLRRKQYLQEDLRTVTQKSYAKKLRKKVTQKSYAKNYTYEAKLNTRAATNSDTLVNISHAVHNQLWRKRLMHRLH